MISQTELKLLMNYDPLTGHLIWRINRGTRARAGQIAGALDPQGYVVIGVNNRSYLAHRLVYLHQTGQWPPLEIDHINQNKSDNRWLNLRLATPSQNKANRAKYKGKLPKGVARNGRGYNAYITAGKIRAHLGYFPTAEQAHAAYCEAAQQAFGAYHRAG